MPPTPATKTKVLICPYCGDTQPAGERCRACGGLFEPLSRQASHNAMGPWFVREEKRPFQPGASYETIVKLIERGLITKYTILRCPTTKQFWTVARRVPGIAHLLGYCHNCDAVVSPNDHGCPSCGVPFGAYLDRNHLGLPEVKPLPWEAPLIEEGRGVARSAKPTFQPNAAVAMGGGPAVDFRRAAEPLGISSFASDDELRGMASRPPQTYVPAATAEPMPSDVSDVVEHSNGEAHAAAVPGLIAGAKSRSAMDSTANVAARSMQRRLQQQQSTIRLLMIAIGAVSIISVVVIVAMLVRFGGGNQNGAGQPQKNGAGNATSQGSNGASAAHPAPAVAPANPPATQALENAAPSTTLPANDLTPPAAEVSVSFKSDREKAAGLLIEAKKDTRPLKDRIKDAEAAVVLIKNIKAKAPVAEKPEGLDQELLDAERLVERLKLQEFFP